MQEANTNLGARQGAEHDQRRGDERNLGTQAVTHGPDEGCGRNGHQGGGSGPALVQAQDGHQCGHQHNAASDPE